MKLAIIGSRTRKIDNLEDYLPSNVDKIISGGATGVDTCAKQYAQKHHIKLKEFLPNYDKHGKNAPLIRNISIIESADMVFAFWDGKSRGTKFVINNCKKETYQ